MANFNKVILLGNLTRDPELSYTANSTALCKFGMAVNRRWKDQEGSQRDETCFVDCTMFGRRAEVLNQYVKKGNPLLIEGRLQFSQWTNQEGQKRSKLAVVVENFEFMSGRSSDGGGQQQAVPAAQTAAHEQGPPAEVHSPPPTEEGGNIPF